MSASCWSPKQSGTRILFASAIMLGSMQRELANQWSGGLVGGVAVETLPVGYRVVGGISVAYAALMGLVLVLFASAALNQSPPRGALDWLGIAAFVLSPVALFTSGCLLFARSEPALRRGAWASMIAAAVLLCKA